MQNMIMPQYAARLSVRLSVTFRYHDHICWKTNKIISLPISIRFLLGLTPQWAIWSKGNTPKIMVKYGWDNEHKNLQYLCKTWPRLLWQTNRKSHCALLIGTKINDLGWPWRVEPTHEKMFYGAQLQRGSGALDWYRVIHRYTHTRIFTHTNQTDLVYTYSQPVGRQIRQQHVYILAGLQGTLPHCPFQLLHFHSTSW